MFKGGFTPPVPCHALLLKKNIEYIRNSEHVITYFIPVGLTTNLVYATKHDTRHVDV